MTGRILKHLCTLYPCRYVSSCAGLFHQDLRQPYTLSILLQSLSSPCSSSESHHPWMSAPCPSQRAFYSLHPCLVVPCPLLLPVLLTPFLNTETEAIGHRCTTKVGSVWDGSSCLMSSNFHTSLLVLGWGWGELFWAGEKSCLQQIFSPPGLRNDCTNILSSAEQE